MAPHQVHWKAPIFTMILRTFLIRIPTIPILICSYFVWLDMFGLFLREKNKPALLCNSWCLILIMVVLQHGQMLNKNTEKHGVTASRPWEPFMGNKTGWCYTCPSEKKSQLGLWRSQLNGKKHVPNHQPELCFMGIIKRKKQFSGRPHRRNFHAHTSKLRCFEPRWSRCVWKCGASPNF